MLSRARHDHRARWRLAAGAQNKGVNGDRARDLGCSTAHKPRAGGGPSSCVPPVLDTPE